MSLTSADTYYVKALSTFSFDMENSIESLNYALGCDPDHAPSNCLMGRIYMEYIKNYEKAEEYFGYAIASDPKYPDTYEAFSQVLIWKGDIRHALRLINFGFKLPGIDRAILYSRRAQIYEIQGQPKLAIKAIKTALEHSYNTGYMWHFEMELERVKKKAKQLKKRKKK